MKDWKQRAAILAFGVSVGAGGNIALNDPEVITIIEKTPPEVIEVVKAYRFNTQEEFLARKRELIETARTGRLTIGGGELEELFSLTALESVIHKDDPIRVIDFSGDGKALLNAVLDAESKR